MRLRSLISFIAVLAAGQYIFSAPKFPFPQDQKYPYGIKPTKANHNDVQAAYELFVKNYYEESGDQARIKWDVPSQTVSEGIGYGMLIMVHMDNAVNSTQPKFDKLWNYYQKHLNGNGLMNWKIEGFGGTAGDGQNGATDGDLDVAFALNLAYYQWGGDKYKTDAGNLMGKIYNHEVAGNKLLKPGDAWDYPKNPSYVVAAGLGLFNETKFGGGDWASIKSANYTLLKNCANGTTGLVPDWCNDNGQADGKGPHYKSDAARTPWRMALAYTWYGDADAKTIADKMTQWIKTSTNNDPTLIMDGYQLNGTKIGTFNITMYLGPFACAAMVDGTHQAWLDACYTRLASFIDNTGYYNECLKLLSLLHLTGNCLNYKTVQPKTEFTITTAIMPANAGTVKITPEMAKYPLNTSVTVTATPSGSNKFASWGGDLKGTETTKTFTITCDMNITAYFNAGAGDLVDDCEDGNNLTNLGSKWFTYNDSTDKGKSTVDPKTSDLKLFTMTDGGAAGTKKAAKISYTLDKADAKYNPYAGIGFGLNKAETVMDISSATGLTFYFKGGITDVRVETTNITDFGFFFKRLAASADWKLISLQWSDFAQAPWAKKADFDRTKAIKIAWQTPDIGKTGDKGEICLDEVHLPGYSIIVNTSDKPAVVYDNEFFVSRSSPSSVTVRYALRAAGGAEIGLYSLSGELLKHIVTAGMQPGNHEATVNLSGTGRAGGAYIIQLKTADRSFSHKFMQLQ